MAGCCAFAWEASESAFTGIIAIIMVAADQRALGVVSRRPAIPVAGALVLGILLHPLIPAGPVLLMACIAALALAGVVCVSKSYFGSGILLVALIGCGVGIGRREHFQYSSSDIGLFSADEPRLAEVELRVIEEPHLFSSSLGQLRQLPPKQFMSAEVLRVKTLEGWVPASGVLPVTVNQVDPSLNVGQTLHAFGMLSRPTAAANPGQFDWAAYYREQRILASLTVTRIGNIEILDEPGLSPITWMRVKARHLLARGFTADHAVDHALLAALFLGDRDPPLRDVQEEFEKTGVAYQLNVSGLHIAMVGGFVLLLCRLAFVRPRLSLIIAEVFVLMYGLVALPSHSGVRSVILCTVIFLAQWTHRTTDKFQMMALCFIAMLLYHPLDLYSFGFQLSFAAVFGLALLLSRWKGVLVLRDAHMELAPKSASPFAIRVLSMLRIRLWTLFLMCAVVWIAILPLVLRYVGEVNLWSIFGAVLVFPIASAALLGGLFKVVCTLLWPGGAGWWATVAGLPVILMRHVVEALNRLPSGHFAVAAPPVWLIVVYYGLLVLPLLPVVPAFRGRRRWVVRCAPVCGLAAIFILPAFPRLNHLSGPADELDVTLLSLGAGQCAVIQPAGSPAILFDAGSDSVSDLVGKIVGPFLRTQGQSRVEEIFLSHGDYDHISAAGEIASSYAVHDFFISPHFRRNAVGNIPDQLLLEKMDDLNLPPHIVRRGNHLDLPGGAGVDVLWPPADGDWNSNNAGLVLRLSYGGRTILFPADIQDAAFQGLLRHPEELKADILVAPHHGSSESLTPAFLRAVAPKIILSSNAWTLTSKQKRFDGMVGNTPLYRTSKYGAITVMVSKNGSISLTMFLQGRVLDVN